MFSIQKHKPLGLSIYIVELIWFIILKCIDVLRFQFIFVFHKGVFHISKKKTDQVWCFVLFLLTHDSNGATIAGLF